MSDPSPQIFCSIGAVLVLRVFRLMPFDSRLVTSSAYVRRIVPLAVIFCSNIILGNISLRFVP
jgi:hypothetical protein